MFHFEEFENNHIKFYNMSNELYSALTVLIVGMLTVFTILSLVVLCGQVIIRVVNALHVPEPEELLAEHSGIRLADSGVGPNGKQLAAIVAAVEQVTQGKGRIERIEKIYKN